MINWQEKYRFYLSGLKKHWPTALIAVSFWIMARQLTLHLTPTSKFWWLPTSWWYVGLIWLAIFFGLSYLTLNRRLGWWLSLIWPIGVMLWKLKFEPFWVLMAGITFILFISYKLKR